MKAPIKELKELQKLVEQAREAISTGKLDAAEETLRKAFTIDDRHIPAVEMMAALFEARGKNHQAEQWRARVKAIRLENWERQVEAEARGRHEVMGEVVRHEIP